MEKGISRRIEFHQAAATSGGKRGLALAGTISLVLGGSVGALVAWLAGVSWLLAALVALACVFAFYMEGAYRVWDKTDQERRAALEQAEAKRPPSPAITVIGGTGGVGYNAGGGGGAAGPGGNAGGGRGGESMGLLEAIAWSIRGTGLSLDAVIQRAGFTLHSPELYRHPRGGDGGSAGGGGGGGAAVAESPEMPGGDEG